MHDGSLNTLWDVVDHYNAGGEANPYLDGGMEALDLTEQEIDQVVAFLFSLTDKRLAKLNDEEMAKQREQAKANRPERDEALATRKELPFERRVMGAAAGKGGGE
jgi:cytochrome c peroxidase